LAKTIINSGKITMNCLLSTPGRKKIAYFRSGKMHGLSWKTVQPPACPAAQFSTSLSLLPAVSGERIKQVNCCVYGGFENFFSQSHFPKNRLTI
jgi:hypothetical protein